MLVPAEHGGWAFLAEPIVLGLLVACSTAGLLLAAAAVSAFLARQPLRLFLSDRRRSRRYARTVVAERAFAACAVTGALALAGAVLLARGPALLALGLAAPLAASALALDLARRSRELAAELAAALALAAVAPAIALAGGRAVGPALGLWLILAARIVPSVLYVRARLRMERGEPAAIAPALVAHAVALAGALSLASRGLMPWLGAGAIALLGLRAVYGLSRLRPWLTTRQLGVSEVVFGALAVLAIAAGVAFRL